MLNNKFHTVVPGLSQRRRSIYLGRISSLKGLPSTEIDCPGKWWNCHHWKCSRNDWIWHSLPWSGSQGRDRSKAAHYDPGGFSKLNNSMILWFCFPKAREVCTPEDSQTQPLMHITTFTCFLYLPFWNYCCHFYEYLLGLPLQLLTPNGGVLAQTPLCFLFFLEADPQGLGAEREPQHNPTGLRVQASFLQEETLWWESDLCMVWALPGKSTTKQLSPRRSLDADSRVFGSSTVWCLYIRYGKEQWLPEVIQEQFEEFNCRSHKSAFSHLLNKPWCLYDTKLVNFV